MVISLAGLFDYYVVDMGLYRYPLQLICAFTDTQSNREVNPGSNLGYIPYHKGIMYVL